MKRRHEMPFGARLDGRGGATFRLWAPAAQAVDLVRSGAGLAEREAPMGALAHGWFELAVAQLDGRTDYRFRIDHGLLVPDPASRCNHADVHGPSALVDPCSFDWPDDGWCGRPWCEAVIYELHIGCFTGAGSFDAAIDRLDELVALGINTIELMPVADFSGQHGWGYDGVLLFAPKAAYGPPDALKRLVVAAHQRGLAVLLDVVYNHFGPDGNYLHASAPAFFDARQTTPWGAAINFDGRASRTVRDFFIHNALYWIEEFQLDGLRLDAVHAMVDAGTPHFVDELALALRAGPGRERAVHLVIENEHNQAAHLQRDAAGEACFADAQWNDDVHHALHVIATGEVDGYYADYAADPGCADLDCADAAACARSARSADCAVRADHTQAPLRLFGRALAEGFGYQGEPSRFRGGAARGTASAQLPPSAFVDSLQTHDQIGNRAFGERISQLAHAAGRDDALRALVACVLLAPAPPMLFMGEEWGAASPFLYFCDYTGELAQAITQGRRAEFARAAGFGDTARRATIPDPNAASSFLRSKLDWSERTRPPHAGWLALYGDLLRLRRQHLQPWLGGAASGQASWPDPGTLRLSWPLGGGRVWHLQARLANHAAPARRADELPGEVVYLSHLASAHLPAWSVACTVEHP